MLGLDHQFRMKGFLEVLDLFSLLYCGFCCFVGLVFETELFELKDFVIVCEDLDLLEQD